MKTPIWLVILQVAISSTAFGQDTWPGKDCGDYFGFGAKTLAAFDAELRAALTKQDIEALSLLVRFPLRINESDGSTYSLDNPPALQRHFADVFPSRVRSAVLNQKLDDVTCVSMGVVYRYGEVDLVPTKIGWSVGSVNLSGEGSDRNTNAASARVGFVCRSEKYRVAIDSNAKGKQRYRAWKMPRSILERPDLEIPNGSSAVEGTGGCAHTVWSFKDGATSYSVEELGCFPDSNQPPEGARGQLLIAEKGREDQWWWCY
jgi:hypothetical protein